MTVEAALAWVDERRADLLAQFSDLLRIPSISTDPAYAAEVRRCATVDCPFWPYRMGRNPHNPRRGERPSFEGVKS